MARLTTCLVCGDIIEAPRSRCKAHQTRGRGHQESAHRRGLGRQHRAIRDRVIAAWVARNGWTCPGWQRPAHPVPVGGLTGDHTVPRSVAPELAADPSNMAVLCGVCNSRRGARPWPDAR